MARQSEQTDWSVKANRMLGQTVQRSSKAKRSAQRRVAPAARPLRVPAVSEATVQTKWTVNPTDPFEIQASAGWHAVARWGRWDIEAIRQEMGAHLIHSLLVDRGRTNCGGNFRRDDLVFALSETVYVTFRVAGRIWLMRVWATSESEAVQEYSRLRDRYLRPDAGAEKHHGEFYVLDGGGMELDKRLVSLSSQATNPADLALHYGEGFDSWHSEFVKMLLSRSTGIAILQGPPGTGKTSYLRHLLYSLQATHRFYYLPANVSPLLAAPSAVNFWVRENDLHGHLTKVVLIEDAEALLMQRDNSNQQSVSNLLNIADGFLGDFLKLHVICTINAKIDKLDPAILRPGRLTTLREFRKLTACEARRLAAAKGLALEPRDEYSLAEVYNSATVIADGHEPRMVGFAA